VENDAGERYHVELRLGLWRLGEHTALGYKMYDYHRLHFERSLEPSTYWMLLENGIDTQNNDRHKTHYCPHHAPITK
jgi:hypothetical protein